MTAITLTPAAPADLQPGDIMFGPIGGLVPGVFPVGAGQLLLGEVFRAGQLSVRHVGIVVEHAESACDGDPTAFTPTACGRLSAHPAHALGVHPHRPPRGPMLVQALPGGAEEIELTSEHWTPRHAYLRLPEDYPGQAADAAAIARLFVSEQVPYSFLSYVALAAWRFGIRAERLAKWINRRRDPIPFEGAGTWRDIKHVRKNGFVDLPAEAICSVLVDQAWTLAGKDVMPGVAEQAVTPGALANQLWRTPGAAWTLPGAL